MLVQHTAYTYNDDTIALQRQGIAMGTCDSPVEANLTLLFYEYNFAETLAECIVYKRFIDDILIITKKDDLKRISKCLNWIFPTNIQLIPTKQPT